MERIDVCGPCVRTRGWEARLLFPRRLALLGLFLLMACTTPRATTPEAPSAPSPTAARPPAPEPPRPDAGSRGTVAVDGGELAYDITGTGPVVVLIHGGLVDSRLWDDQLDALQEGHRVLRYDLRGFGRSPFPTAPFSHVDDLHRLLDALSIDRATLVGLSLGGMIALDYALEHPERIDALVLTSSAVRGFPYKPTPQDIAPYRASRDEGIDPAVARWLEHPMFASGAVDPRYRARAATMLKENARTWKLPPEYGPLVRWPSWSTLDRLPEIRVPTLIIVGDRDSAAILETADTLQARLPDARRVTLPGVSHHLNMEQPAVYNAHLLEFLDRR